MAGVESFDAWFLSTTISPNFYLNYDMMVMIFTLIFIYCKNIKS